MKRVALVTLVIMLVSMGGVFANGSQERSSSASNDGYVIALSNSFYGNSWRKQMVDTFVEAAEEAKAAGRISEYMVVNGDGTQNTQIAQLNSLILSGVDAICINAASPTALNGVIEKAVEQGIMVLTFDSIVTTDAAYKMDYDLKSWGEIQAQYIVDKFNGNARVLEVRGIRGSAPEIEIHAGIEEVFSQNPGIAVVAEIDGQADAATTQNAVANVLPSLGDIDAVVTQGGSYGVVQAYEAAGKKLPVIIGGNRAEFIKWWADEKEKNGYETISLGTEPSIGAIAFWTALEILEGKDVPKTIKLPLVALTNETLDQYKDIQPGTVLAQKYDEAFVLENILAK
ncbi:MAG: ABC transporter substrate-binding protein [Sphaerochaetaceae bacterium]|nr:ABC transporter substrate-binding protein [Sphaerochaetaceae bacterium]